MHDEHLTDRINLYLYGEMDESETARFEAELNRSSELESAVESERRFLQMLGGRAPAEASDLLLAECRHDLLRAVHREQRVQPPLGFVAWLQRSVPNWGQARISWQPVLALLLVGLGFFGGRATESFWSKPAGPAGPRDGSPVGEAVDASLVSLGPDLSDVQSIDLDPRGGQVRIVVEERRTISGDASDPAIRNLLMSMARSSNSGVRLESLDALRQRTQDGAIRSMLITAMLEDANPGIRLKALEALTGHTSEPDVRQALAAVLRRDNNPGMRVQAIELLTANPDRELVGVLQDVMRDEPNNYVRLQCERTLEAMDASAEVY